MKVYFATTEKYTVFAVDSGGSSLELFVQTMYFGNKKDTQSTIGLSKRISQMGTHETSQSTIVSNNNIRTENTKSQEKYSLKIQQDGEKTDTWYSLKITANMKDSERAELLNKKIVSVPIYNGQADRIIKDESTNLISSKRSLAESALLKVAEEFGIYDEGKNKNRGLGIRTRG